MPDKPNILLVHGAWGDASHWRHVIPPLHEKGYRVFAVQNPLTSLSDDIDVTSKLTAAQDAPTLLVGHAYGCAVIAGAGLMPNVVGLIYLAGPALDEGESLKSLWARRAPPEGRLISNRTSMGFYGSNPRNFTRPSVTISKTKRNRWCGLQRRSQQQARCFEEKSGAPAWKVKPSWYQISANDRFDSYGDGKVDGRANQRKKDYYNLFGVSCHGSMTRLQSMMLIEEASSFVIA